MFNLIRNENRLCLGEVIRNGDYSSENYAFSLSWIPIRAHNNLKRGIIFITMNLFFKIAAGVIGGLAIVASLGGFSKNNSEAKKDNNDVLNSSSDSIPDDIFDGNNNIAPQNKGERVRRETEQGVRNLQEGLTKASNVLGHISIICNSIVKMFYEDPYVRVTPTTYIL